MRLTWALMAVIAAAGAGAGGQETKPIEPRTLTYASRGGVDLFLDLYLPAKPIRRPAPVIVFLHGGGWSGGIFAERSRRLRLTPR